MQTDKEQFTEWIDDDVIADAIFEALKEQSIPTTFKNATLVWLDVLHSELPDAIANSVEALDSRSYFEK
jgi:hypothetical protein